MLFGGQKCRTQNTPTDVTASPGLPAIFCFHVLWLGVDSHLLMFLIVQVTTCCERPEETLECCTEDCERPSSFGGPQAVGADG